MLNIPDNILVQYEAILKKKVSDVSDHRQYKKWLRYFMDFCDKYHVAGPESERVRLFVEKLRENKQSPEQQKQAAYAVSLYFEIQRKLDYETPPVRINTKTTSSSIQPPSVNSLPKFYEKREILQTVVSSVSEPQQSKHVSTAKYVVKSDSPEWDKVIKYGKNWVLSKEM